MFAIIEIPDSRSWIWNRTYHFKGIRSDVQFQFRIKDVTMGRRNWL